MPHGTSLYSKLKLISTYSPACLGHADTYASMGDTAILRGRGGGGAWTSQQVWRQNLGQDPAKFTK